MLLSVPTMPSKVSKYLLASSIVVRLYSLVIDVNEKLQFTLKYFLNFSFFLAVSKQTSSAGFPFTATKIPLISSFQSHISTVYTMQERWLILSGNPIQSTNVRQR